MVITAAQVDIWHASTGETPNLEFGTLLRGVSTAVHHVPTA
jgi:hypothetical protein